MIKEVWTKGLDEEVKGEFKEHYVRAKPVRERLSLILSDKLKTAERIATSSQGYKEVNWAYKQADIVGYKRALKEISSLL